MLRLARGHQEDSAETDEAAWAKTWRLEPKSKLHQPTGWVKTSKGPDNPTLLTLPIGVIPNWFTSVCIHIAC